ncbi:MAG: ribosome-associated translation inhibitor RaiA [Clostridia bacterium]|nr:ribosome-associated translation inhibitor RaiA [Clostridia bacterium]
MKIKITGKELKATEAIKEYVEKKCERLQKYSDDEIDVQVTIKTEGINQVAEISAAINGDIYRAVTENKDLYASIDKDIDILEGQIRKTKAKKDKQNMSGSIKEMAEISFSVEDHKVENEILKTSYYELKPMSAEDAKLVLSERVKDNFLVFVNIDTEKVNVIFKLKDGKNFGLVEPEA